MAPNKKKKVGKKKVGEKKVPKPCFCHMTEKDFEGKTETNWDEIFEIPGISDFELRGNDSNESIKSSKVHLATFGRKFESLLSESEAQLDYPLSIVRLLNIFALNWKLDETCQDEQLPELLRAAKEFNIPGLKKLASEKLMATLNDDNVLRIYHLVEDFLCSHIVKHVEDIILAKIQDLVKNHGFLSNCSASWIRKWLKDDRLNASEETVFLILQSWASLSPENGDAFLSLAKNIRFQLLPMEFFKETVKPTLDPSWAKRVEKSIQVRSLAETVWVNSWPQETYLASLKPVLSKLSMSQKVEKAIVDFPRGCRLPNELVFAFGGRSTRNSKSKIEVFDIRSETWHFFNWTLFGYEQGIVAYQNELLLFGGRKNGGELLGNASLNILTKKITSIPAVPSENKVLHQAVELDGQVFVLGGRPINGNPATTVVKWNIEDKIWTNCQPMPEVRQRGCTVACNNKIFVIGGVQANGEAFLRTDIYDPVSDQWRSGPALNVVRSWHQVGA